jgi:predicted RNA-binding Zn ribbon-like protein
MTIVNAMLVIRNHTTTMNERDKRRVGEQIEPGGRPKAPGRLELLQRFVNTWNHELPTEWDRLGTSTKAGSWLREKGLTSSSARVAARDVARLRELREAIRALAVANHGDTPSPAASAVVRRASRSAELRIGLDELGWTWLEPVRGGIDGAIATLLGILHEASISGDWPRLKGCRRCGYVFFDRSKNCSASWCAMSICGNRVKNRAYRQRRSLTSSRGRSV